MEVERAPFETTILHMRPAFSFHVNLGEGIYFLGLMVIEKETRNKNNKQVCHLTASGVGVGYFPKALGQEIWTTDALRLLLTYATADVVLADL